MSFYDSLYALLFMLVIVFFWDIMFYYFPSFFSYVQSGINSKYKYLVEIRNFLYSNQSAFYKQSLLD
jgi:hypothetical protein